MPQSLRFSATLALCMGVFAPMLVSRNAQAAPKASSTPAPLSTEAKVRAEFVAWRYDGAKISASFQRGPLSLLSITTTDSMEKVWKFYMSRIPTESKVPLAYSWDIPGDNTMIGANYTLGSSYVVSLNSSPREGGTIAYQKGTENVVIEIRARTPEQVKATGVNTDIKLIKMRPLPPAKTTQPPGTTPVQGTSNPASVW